MCDHSSISVKRLFLCLNEETRGGGEREKKEGGTCLAESLERKREGERGKRKRERKEESKNSLSHFLPKITSKLTST